MEPQQVFALAMRNLTGRNIPLALGEELYGADLTSDKTLRDSLTKKGKDEFEALIQPPEAEAALETSKHLREIKEKAGDIADNTLRAIAAALGAISLAIDKWGEWFSALGAARPGELVTGMRPNPNTRPGETDRDVEPR